MSAPLAQSVDKKVLFARLGLNEETHKLLLLEAEHARNSLSVNPQNLTDTSRGNPAVLAPYKWDEISETAKHNQILVTVNTSRSETRPYYYMGRYMTNVNEENWVARWYLWHTFRYRDNRPRSRAATNVPGHGHGGGQASYNAGGYYDPARGHYR